MIALLLFVFSSTAYADYFQFSVRSKDFGALVQVKNCVDYNVCTKTGGVLAGDEKEYRFHTFVDLDPAELTNVLNECSLTLGIYQASVMNLTTKQPVSYAHFPKTKAESFSGVGAALGSAWDEFRRQDRSLLERIPVFNPDYSESSLWSVHRGIQNLMDGNRPTEAIAAVLKEFKFQTLGYTISVDPAMGESVLAVTNHESKTIRLNRSTVKESCELVYTLRHEVEHIHQMDRALRCIDKGGSSGFVEHIDRERSAYMNDVFNAKRLCPQKSIRNEFESDQQDLFFQSYIQN